MQAVGVVHIFNVRGRGISLSTGFRGGEQKSGTEEVQNRYSLSAFDWQVFEHLSGVYISSNEPTYTLDLPFLLSLRKLCYSQQMNKWPPSEHPHLFRDCNWLKLMSIKSIIFLCRDKQVQTCRLQRGNQKDAGITQ